MLGDKEEDITSSVNEAIQGMEKHY